MSHSTTRPTLSIIIPALDAGATIAAVLDAVQAPDETLPREIIVVDGGSRDATASLARERGVRVIGAPRGRGTQLRAGAQAATGSWLLFLHADSVPEAGWNAVLRQFMNAPGNRCRAAAFRLAFDDPAPQARRVARLANWRSEFLKLPYGDQGLLISRDFYGKIGGYKPILLMEDVELVRRIGRRRLVILPVAVRTSAVRYRRDGWVRRPLRNLSLLALFFLGASPTMLQRLYR